MSLGKNIRQLRKAKGFSQEFIAEQLGYKSYTTIQKWESGVSEPSLSQSTKLSELLGVTLSELLQDNSETSTNQPEAKTIPIKNNFPTTPREQNVIGKYRLLDDFGQEQVDRTIDNELERVESLEIHTIAAHADNMENIDDETIAQLKRIVMEHKRKKQQEDKG